MLSVTLAASYILLPILFYGLLMVYVQARHPKAGPVTWALVAFVIAFWAAIVLLTTFSVLGGGR
jgi:hypothetical protein